MRKIFTVFLLTILLLSTTNTTFAQSYESTTSMIEKFNNNGVEYTFDDVLSLEPYIQVKDSLFIFDVEAANDAGVEQELIKGQQQYLDFLNQQAKDNILSISDDLTIQNLSDNNNLYQSTSITTFAKCTPKGINTNPQQHWWGYSVKTDSCVTADIIVELNTVAAGGTIAAGSLAFLGIFFPTITYSRSYFWCRSRIFLVIGNSFRC